jgi:hypothetical protein
MIAVRGTAGRLAGVAKGMVLGLQPRVCTDRDQGWQVVGLAQGSASDRMPPYEGSPSLARPVAARGGGPLPAGGALDRGGCLA